MTHDVFICHSSQDRTIANAICATLEEHRIRCWIAPRDVIPGVEYAQSIIEAIGRSTLTVLVFSGHANASPHVRRELERTASHGIPILPFRVEDVVPGPSVEYFISDAHWLDAMTPPLEEHLEHLVGTVRLLLDRQAALSAERSATGTAASGGSTTGTALLETVPSAPPGGGRRSRALLYAVLGGAVLVLAGVVALLVNLFGGAPEGAPVEDDPTGTVAEQVTPDPAAPEQEPTVPAVTGPLALEFDEGIGEGWAWENEDPDTWSVVDGALRIEVQESPPLRNVLLRDLPEGDVSVLTQLEFDPQAPGHAAGLVLAGPDLGDRVELLWTTEGLKLWTYEDGVMADGVEIMRDQFVDDEWIGAQLRLDLTSGFWTAVFDSDVSVNWEIDTAPLPEGVARVGLLAYATEQAPGETAVFDRFVIEPLP